MKNKLNYQIFFGGVILLGLVNAVGVEAAETIFENPMGFSTVTGLLTSILENLMAVVVTIALLFIILGGILYLSSGGNEKMVTQAKACWTGAAIGLAIILAAPTFVKELQKILGGEGNGENADAWVSEALTIQDIALNVLTELLSILGIIAIIALVIGGGMYLTSLGDDDRIKTGKKIINYAIIGVIVSLSAVIIVRELQTLIVGE